MTISYLMRKLNEPTYTIFQKVREKRPRISPNFGFYKQLLAYQHELGIENEEDWSDERYNFYIMGV